MVSLRTMISVNEGDGNVQVCAILFSIEDIERDFIIALNTNDGTGNNLCTYYTLTYINGC